MVEGERIDYALEQRTHLPTRVSRYDVVNGKSYVNVQSLSDYIDVNGIKMPQAIIGDDGAKERASFSFNVEYKKIFKTPPPIEAATEGWKRKS
jgi:hypothetical protein